MSEPRAILVTGAGGQLGTELQRCAWGDGWDVVAIAMYPSRAAMAKMMQSEKMQEIGVHRAAGLAGQLNIETANAQGEWLGKPFGT